jgi:hypothetical protein
MARLASDLSSYVTGAVIDVNGGAHISLKPRPRIVAWSQTRQSGVTLPSTQWR